MRIVRSLVMAETSSNRGVSPRPALRAYASPGSLVHPAPALGDAASSIGATVHSGLGGAHRLDDCESLLKKTSESPQADAAGTAAATAGLAPGAPKLMVVLMRTHRSVADLLPGAPLGKSVSWEEVLLLRGLLHKGALEGSSIGSQVPDA